MSRSFEAYTTPTSQQQTQQINCSEKGTKMPAITSVGPVSSSSKSSYSSLTEDYYDCQVAEEQHQQLLSGKAVEAAAAAVVVYSTVTKRPRGEEGGAAVATTTCGPKEWRTSLVETYSSLPGWLKTCSLQRPKLNAPLPKPSFYFLNTPKDFINGRNKVLHL